METPLLKMKERPNGFLDPDNVPSEVFDYVKELHLILWRFVRAEYSNASGNLDLWIPSALTTAEHRANRMEK